MQICYSLGNIPGKKPGPCVVQTAGFPGLRRVQRVSTANHPPYSVVLTYSEDLQQLIVHTVNPSRLAPLTEGRMGVVMADEEGFKLDDEFARQLGIGMLNTIALGQADIKQYMTFTEGPIDRSSGQ